MNLVSPCCGEPVRVASARYRMDSTTPLDDAMRVGTTNWYECTLCHKPCDPVEEEKS